MTWLSARYRPAPAPARVINALLFNASWFAIVASHSSLLAPLIVLTHLFVHFSMVGFQRSEGQFIVLVTLVGLVLDQLLFALGVLAGPSLLAPLWLSCLWPVLATTMMHAFQVLQPRLLIAAVFGATGGALSYIAGTRLSDIAFGHGWGPVALAVIWAVLFPLLLRLAAQLSTTRYATQP